MSADPIQPIAAKRWLSTNYPFPGRPDLNELIYVGAMLVVVTAAIVGVDWLVFMVLS